MIFIKHYNSPALHPYLNPPITSCLIDGPFHGLILIDKVVIMSSSKPRINIERALRELNL
jgi:hypothetical protein